MKRPMCVLAVAWLAGLFMAGRWPEFERNYSIFLYFILVIIFLLILKKYPRMLDEQVKVNRYPQLTILLLLAPCMFFAGGWRMEKASAVQKESELPWILYEEKGETYVTVQGIVKEKSCGEQVTLILTDCRIIGENGQENQPAGDCRVMVETEGLEWLPETFVGNELRVFGKFSVFQAAGNPGQFDVHDYYTGKGIYADVDALRIIVLDSGKSMVGHIMFWLKQRMRESLQELYPVEKAGVLAAMMLGDKDLLPEEMKELYQQNGISHILAISGLHISMLCMGMFHLLRKLGASQEFSVMAAVSFLILYIIYTGAGTSSLRAGVMCLVLFGAKLLRRSYDLLSSLSVAAIVVTLLRPTELISAGFLLSFGAVLGVIMAQEVEYSVMQERDGKKVRLGALLSGAMIQCVTIPLSLWFFYELSPYSILLNLVVIPLVALILGGGILSMLLGMIFPVLAHLPAGGTYLLLDFYENLGKFTQKLPFSFVLAGKPELWQMVVYYLVLFTTLKKVTAGVKKRVQEKEGKEEIAAKKTPVRMLIAGMALAVGVLCVPERQKVHLLFLDVSQGDGMLIYTEDGVVILSDCGSSDVSQIGKYRLSPVLKQNGTLLLDMAVISHLDSDHTSGIKELLTNMPVYKGRLHYAANYKGEPGIRQLVLPKVQEKSNAYAELEALAARKNVKVRYIEEGDVLHQENELLIECLYPSKARESENDTSLVFLLQTPELLAWLMGDAGISAEEKVLKELSGVNLKELRQNKLVLLKVGHHGSKTASGEEFIEYVQPDIAVISCGYNNSYGHPHVSVVKRLERLGSQVFRTDLQGAVIVKKGIWDEMEVYSWRKKRQK